MHPLIVTLAIAFCMNPVTLAGNRAVKQVKSAETLLAKGKYKQALQKLDEHRYEFADEGLSARAAVIRAVASVRVGWDVEHSVAVLDDALARDDEQPAVQAWLAEALLAKGETQDPDRAHELLEDLAERDLVPDAHAWRALAITRTAGGDDAGAATALARCKKATKKKALCKLP